MANNKAGIDSGGTNTAAPTPGSKAPICHLDPARRCTSKEPISHRQRQPLDRAEFWDQLSQIPLCRSALREFNRRHPPAAVPTPPLTVFALEGHLIELPSHFSRRGGPNLRNVRGVGWSVASDTVS
jgi:hypothetical protein